MIIHANSKVYKPNRHSKSMLFIQSNQNNRFNRNLKSISQLDDKGNFMVKIQKDKTQSLNSPDSSHFSKKLSIIKMPLIQ